MEPIFQKDFELTDIYVDRYGRLKPSAILLLAQEVAGMHCTELSVDSNTLEKQRLFWAVSRHRVQITRLPRIGETIHVETWPMPTTRVAYPRSMVAYDENGNECFRSVTLWVLMDLDTRNMILPGKSGIIVSGTVRGGELAIPGGLIPKPLGSQQKRTVCFTDLDRNGHMNNTRYLDWTDDLLPSAFHFTNTLKEFTICYLSEAREGQTLNLNWDLPEEKNLQVEGSREEDGNRHRVFSARLIYG